MNAIRAGTGSPKASAPARSQTAVRVARQRELALAEGAQRRAETARRRAERKAARLREVAHCSYCDLPFTHLRSHNLCPRCRKDPVARAEMARLKAEMWRSLPPEPCPGAAGSQQKIDAMVTRYAAGFHVHHPDDCRTVLRRVFGDPEATDTLRTYEDPDSDPDE